MNWNANKSATNYATFVINPFALAQTCPKPSCP